MEKKGSWGLFNLSAYSSGKAHQGKAEAYPHLEFLSFDQLKEHKGQIINI